MKHVKLPYRVGYNGGVTGPSVSPLVFLDEQAGCEYTLVSAEDITPLGYGNNQAVAVCFGGHQEANAEYIVKACNMHHELVEALESFVKVTQNVKAKELLKRAKQ